MASLKGSAMSDEAAERQRVVAVARTWLGTPYHPNAQVRGAGVDCANLPAAVYAEAGMIQPVKIPWYPPEWMMHQEAERFLGVIIENGAREIPEAEAGPGDLACFRFGRCFSHGAIVVAWPTVIHAQVKAPVMIDDVSKAKWMMFIGETVADQGKPRPRRFFTLWPRP